MDGICNYFVKTAMIKQIKHLYYYYYYCCYYYYYYYYYY